MRTWILFGLLVVADSTQIGYEMGGSTSAMTLVLLCGGMIMDMVDFFRGK